MKLVTGLLAAVLLLAGVGASHAVVRIAEDRGGRIGTYVDKYQDLRSSGETVIIDGLCASACTIVLGAVPHDKICVTSHATLGFHAAWDFGANGRAITNPEATQMLYSMYPSRGAALDRPARRADAAHDFPARQAVDEHVPPLLSRRPGFHRQNPRHRTEIACRLQHDVIGARRSALARRRDWPYLNTTSRQNARSAPPLCRSCIDQPIDEFAHGPADFHAAANTRRVAAGAQAARR